MTSTLLEEIVSSPRLPSLPAVALEVINLVQQPDVSVEALAESISHDPALAGRLLTTVNSSFYAQARTVGTISQAIVLLGLNNVRTLALGFSLVDQFRLLDSGGFDHAAFWRSSLTAATTARALARKVSPTRCEEAFLGGLLHTIGILAMNEALGERYGEVHRTALAQPGDLAARESAALGVTHHEVGARLAEQWNLPAQLGGCIAHYGDPDGAPEAHRDLVRLVAAGRLGSDLFAAEPVPGSLETFRARCEQWFALPGNDCDALIAEVESDVRAILATFDLASKELPSAAEILGQANEALSQISLDVVRETAQLEARNLALASEASTDPLTATANRRQLEQFLEEHGGVAARHGTPLGLLFIDLDHFKRVNDRHGHHAGDVVLQSVATTLMNMVRRADLVARYGGEEFAIVTPGADLPSAVRLAERARAASQSMSLVTAGLDGHVTASIGVAAYDAHRHQSGADVLADADEAVYAAKAAGRNRVMTWTAAQAA